MQTSFRILSPVPGLYLSFQVGRQQYAVPADKLIKVVDGSIIAGSPMPGCFLGLADNEGYLIPVFDLRFGEGGDSITLHIDVGGDAEYPLISVIVYGMPESLSLESSQLETLGVGSHFLSGFPLCGVMRGVDGPVFVLEPVGFANTLIAEAPEVEVVEISVPSIALVEDQLPPIRLLTV